MRRAIGVLVCAAACSDREASSGSTGAGSGDVGATSSSGDATTDACSIADLHQCDAPDLCGTIDTADRPDPTTYGEAELCAFEALRDREPGRLHYMDCSGSSCNGVDILMLADGRAFGDFAWFDAETGASMHGQPMACELPNASTFETCLAAFDPDCSWAAFTLDCRLEEAICTCP